MGNVGQITGRLKGQTAPKRGNTNGEYTLVLIEIANRGKVNVAEVMFKLTHLKRIQEYGKFVKGDIVQVTCDIGAYSGTSQAGEAYNKISLFGKDMTKWEDPDKVEKTGGGAANDNDVFNTGTSGDGSLAQGGQSDDSDVFGGGSSDGGDDGADPFNAI